MANRLGCTTRVEMATVAAAIAVAAVTWGAVSVRSAAPRAPNVRIDFERDVRPVLQKHCVECHGADEQKGGMRLDRRGSALKPRARRIIPGSSATSLVYLRLTGTDFGPQMPVDDALAPAEIETLRHWIDQGAVWPDHLAGDPPPLPPPTPTALQLVDLLRRGDRRAVDRLVSRTPAAGNLRGPGGATVLMYAVLYDDAARIQGLLRRGADPNLTNESGATALMWAVGDVSTTRALLAGGANPNARSETGQTALTLAAGRAGALPVVQALLDHGARLSGADADVALLAAAMAGNGEVCQRLVAHGAVAKGPRPLAAALLTGCTSCADAVSPAMSREALGGVLTLVAGLVDTGTLRSLLDRGAKVDATPPIGAAKGKTPLMLAASSESVSVDAVTLLLERGANLHAKDRYGETALDHARRHGESGITRILVARGAVATAAAPALGPSFQAAPTIRSALARSVPLLQKADAGFVEKGGCVSCHHNSMTSSTLADARTYRVPVDEPAALAQRARVAALVAAGVDNALMARMVTNAATATLVGLAADDHQPDLSTDALAFLIQARQLPDGSWRNAVFDRRPPLHNTAIELSATALRALRVYAPPARRAEFDQVMARGRQWLRGAPARTLDEHAMKILGLAWARVAATDTGITTSAKVLLDEQRPDGGWAQLPTLSSDAYATGQVLVALSEAGVVRTDDAVYRRGVAFLLRTQLADGSWYVSTRALPFQPYFESGFPHGRDQWISAAATNWASQALARAVR